VGRNSLHGVNRLFFLDLEQAKKERFDFCISYSLPFFLVRQSAGASCIFPFFVFPFF